MTSRKSYSGAQIFLHWLIVVLVFFQYVANDLVEALWQARMAGTIPNEPRIIAHVSIGVAILFLVLWRLVQRFRDAAPARPAREPAAARLFTQATHVLFYLLLLALPLSGAAAWFFTVESAAPIHRLLVNLLLVLVAVHVASALIQQLTFKNNVIMRIIGRI